MGCCHTKIKRTKIFWQRNIYGTKFFLHENFEQSRRQLALLEMSIRSYFQPENGLPDPKGRYLVFVAIVTTESLSWSGFAVREGSPQRGGSILCSLHATLFCPAYDLFNFLVRQSNSL